MPAQKTASQASVELQAWHDLLDSAALRLAAATHRIEEAAKLVDKALVTQGADNAGICALASLEGGA